jgi:hypothetical protein
MKNKILEIIRNIAVGTSTAVLGLAGVASAQFSIGTTGPNSNNVITENTTITCTVLNSNFVSVLNNLVQVATSGDANVSGNTIGGSATTGSATNTSSTNTSVSVNNGPSPCPELNGSNSALINLTGPNSNNVINLSGMHIFTRTSVNNVNVGNTAFQGATSGGANVSGNTVGGGAGSGAAWNNAQTGTTAAVANVAPVAPVGGSGGGGGSTTASINLTGPNSNNTITSNNTSNTTITSVNNVNVTNVSTQVATSGDANVSGNTIGGSATTGSAANTASTSTAVSISN